MIALSCLSLFLYVLGLILSLDGVVTLHLRSRHHSISTYIHRRTLHYSLVLLLTHYYRAALTLTYLPNLDLPFYRPPAVDAHATLMNLRNLEYLLASIPKYLLLRLRQQNGQPWPSSSSSTPTTSR
jgi:hypothetical protein